MFVAGINVKNFALFWGALRWNDPIGNVSLIVNKLTIYDLIINLSHW